MVGPPRGRGRRPRGAATAESRRPAPDSQDGDTSMTDAPSNPEIKPDPESSLFVPDAPDLSAAQEASAALANVQDASQPPAASTTVRRPLNAPRGAARRSKEARAALDAAAAAKRDEAARLARSSGSSRGRGPRGGFRGRGGNGRGGFMGDRKELTASGAFGSGQVLDGGRRRTGFVSSGGGSSMGGGFGGGGGRSGGSRSTGVKSEGGPYMMGVDNDDDTDHEYDDDADGIRKDIEFINLVSDDEEKDAAPVRIQRTEHKKRQQPISLQASKLDAEKAERDLEEQITDTTIKRRPSSPVTPRRKAIKDRAKEIEETGSERIWRGAWDSDEDDKSKVKVKQEPTDAEDSSAIVTSPRKSPNKTKTVAVDPAATTVPNDEDAQIPLPDISPARKQKPRRASTRRRAAMPEAQTEEERAEHERYMADLDVLRQELGSLTTMPAPEAAEGQGETDAKPTAPDTSGRSETVYLFQFPPVLPDLAPTAVKAEPMSPEQTKVKMALSDIPSKAAAGSNDKDTPIKVEDNASGTNRSAFEVSRQAMPKLATGRVGKLRVHASGRTTLDWGGTALQVNLASDAQFLQDVLVVRTFEKSEEEKKGKAKDKEKGAALDVGGEALGLGAVRGKFVVTPDWEQIL